MSTSSAPLDQLEPQSPDPAPPYYRNDITVKPHGHLQTSMDGENWTDVNPDNAALDDIEPQPTPPPLQPPGLPSPSYARDARAQFPSFAETAFATPPSPEDQAAAARAGSPQAAAEKATGRPLAQPAGPAEPNDGFYTNPRTGIRTRMSAVPESDNTTLDYPLLAPEHIVGGGSEIAQAEAQAQPEKGVFYTNPRTGQRSQVTSLPPDARRKEMAGASEVIQGVGEASTPLIAAAGLSKPVATTLGFGAGAASSEAAGRIAHAAGASPEAEQLTRNVAFFVPSAIGVLTGLRTGARGTFNEGTAGADVFGGKAGVAVRSTPEAYQGAVKVGGTRLGVNIPRSAPPEPSEAAKALMDFEQHAGNPDFQPAPVPAPDMGPEHLTPDIVQGVSTAILKADPAARAGLMTEAHGNMVKWMMGRGTFVGPDHKIYTIDNEKQASKLAGQFINDEVDRIDKAQTEKAKAAAATGEATLEAPVSGKPPAAKGLTTETAAVQKVAEEANIHPEQQPAIMVKKEPPKEAAALAKPPEPVKPEDAAAIGKEEPESGRPVLQPSEDVMQNERLASEAAPELTTKLSHISAGIEGATFDRIRPQKELERVDEKVDLADKPPETVPDYLAAQIAADTPQAKDELIAAIKKHFEVVSVEDSFLKGREKLAGYPSANVQVKMDNGMTAEVQIVPREVQEIANESHEYYTAGREAELRGDHAEKDRQYAEATKLHEAAMDKFRQRNGIEEVPGGFEKGSTQINIDPTSDLAKAHQAAVEAIPDEHLMPTEFGGTAKGREDKPHVTVRYGLKDDSSEAVQKIRNAAAEIQPFEVPIGKTDTFPPSEHSDGAVPVIARLEVTPELKALRVAMEKAGDFHEDNFPEYKPHLTLAYVKPEFAGQYKGGNHLEGQKVPVREITVSKRDGSQETIPLGGQATTSVPLDDLEAAYQRGEARRARDAAGEHPFDQGWNDAKDTEKSRSVNGLTIKSRFLKEGMGTNGNYEAVQVRAFDSSGKEVSQLEAGLGAEDNPKDVVTSGLHVPEGERGKGYAKALYKSLPSILKDHGISYDNIRSEGFQTEGGEGVWKSLVKEGIAEPAKDSYGNDIFRLKQRRTNVAQRKKVAEMSPEERAHALLTDEKTGLANYRAFKEDEGLFPHVGYADVDDFKTANTILGHQNVDEKVLPVIGEAFRRAIAKEPGGSIKVYHRSGDEFLFRANDPKAVTRVVERVNKELAEAVFTAESPDGTIHEKKGAGLSHGTGKSEADAEHASRADKQRRKEAGLRSGSRDLPGRVGEEPAQGEQAGGREAAQEVKPPEKRIDYELAKKLYPKQKAALSRAENISDLQDRKFAVLKAAQQAVTEWEKFGAWPDGWSRWQRSLDDAYSKFNHAYGTNDQPPRLEDLAAPEEPRSAKSVPLDELEAAPDVENKQPSLADEEKAAGFPGTDWETKDFRIERSGAGQYTVRRKDGSKGNYGTANGLSAAAEKMRKAQKGADYSNAMESALATPEEAPAAKTEQQEIDEARRIGSVHKEEYKIGDHVTYEGKEYKVDWVNPGGSMRLRAEGAEERIPGWISPTRVTPVKAESAQAKQGSFKVGVKTGNDKEWTYNGLRFPTKEAAEQWGHDLSMRWTALKDYEVHESDEPANRDEDGQPLTEGKPAAAEAKEPEKTGAPALIDAVYNKLKAGESLGNVIELTRTAEKAFGTGRTSGEWTPKDMFDAMEAGVNKYLLDAGKDLMAMDADTGLEMLRDLMGRLTSQGTRTEDQIKNQQFSTPPTESYVVAKVAALKPSDVVLEPSAGNGGLAVWPKAIGAEVHVNEIAPRRQEMLKEVGFPDVTNHDGELINALLDPKIKPTVILMNPPFSASTLKSYEAKNNNKYGFNHVEQALQRLAQGGRLVAILGGGREGFQASEGANLRSGDAGKWFDRIAQRYNVRANIRVDGKEYQKYGTSYATRIIVIDKDGPTPSRVNLKPGEVPTWDSVVDKDVKTLEEAYNLLRPVEESRPNVSRPEPAKSNTSLEGHPAPSGVGVRSEPGVPGVRGVSGRSPSTNGEVPAAVRPAGAGSGAPAPRPNGGPSELPTRQHEQGAVEPGGESEPGGRAGASAENGEPQQQVAERGLYLEQLAQEAQREEEDTSAFSVYRPTLKGAAHPGSIVETKAMATVPMPPLTYKPNLPESVVGKAPDYEGAKLSAVQLEAVSIAGMQNDIILPGGYRASALIGDGTGVGKGREGAAILWDNWRKGRKRLVWMTKSKDLIADAVRDLEGIGATDLAKGIKNLGKMDVRDNIEHEGVLFTTYSLFRSAEKGEGGEKGAATRALQVDKWLRGDDGGDGGYLLMDESHMLKNAVVSQGGQASQIGELVKKFLENMPPLRSVSLSATAATDVMNLGYLDRLGLWGPGTPFPNGFAQFAAEISHGGMSAMEMIARELKAQGKYVSRTLTYKGVKYSELEHTLTPEQEEVYTSATEAWESIVQSMEHTIENTTNGGSRQKARAMSQFFGTQQRFFSLLLTSMKIPAAVKATEDALADGKSVVITLINTNEAAQNRERDRVAGSEDDQEIPDYDFGPGRMLSDLVREHYPVQQYKDDVDSNGKPVKTPVFEVGPDGKPTNTPVLNPEAVRARDELIAKLERDLHMPNNPLDELIEQLGGHTKVAELTGRKQRVDPSTGKLVNRGGNGVSQDKVNLNEMANFQAGKKRIAVLSSAADTGISLHSDKGAKNQQQRVGITLQVGWSADKAMQMMGRINRSNQVSAPEYVLLKSNMGGESRFISSIAKRMESLEALSKGQTKTNSGTEAMSKVNFETEQGGSAAVAFYNNLLQNIDIPDAKGKDGKPVSGYDVLQKMRVLKGDPPTVPQNERNNIKRLLNRLMALPPSMQNAVYSYYYDIFEAVVQDAIEKGTIDTGVKKLPGDEFAIKQARELSADPKTGAKTFYYPIEAQVRQHKMPAKEMEAMYDKAKARGDKPNIIKDSKGNLALVVDAKPIVKADGKVIDSVYILKPGNGIPEKVPVSSLHNWTPLNKEQKVALENAKKNVDSAESMRDYYKREVERIEKSEQKHSLDFYRRELASQEAKLKAAEENAKEARKALRAIDVVDLAHDDWQKQHNEAPSHRTAEHHLIGGAVMRFWNAIRESSGHRMDVYSTVDAKSGQRVVGIEIPPDQINKLLARLTGGKSTVTADQIIPDVLRNGTSYDLEGGIKIRRGRVAGNNVVQVVTSNPDIQTQLKNMGVIYERGIQPIYYLQNSLKGHLVMEQILKQYPAKVEAAEAAAAGEAPDITNPNRIVPGGKSAYSANETGLGELQQLTKSIEEGAKGKSWAERIKDAANLGEKAAESKDAVTSLLGRLRGGFAGLLDVMRQEPESSTYEKATGKWSGADQRSALDLYRFTKAIKEAVPDKLKREAISNWIEAGGDDDVLRERAEQSDKKYGPGYEAALELTDHEKTIAQNIMNLHEATLQEAIKAGILEGGVENYIQHVYADRPKIADRLRAEMNFSTLQTKPSFSKKRTLPTYFDAEQLGFTPKDKDVGFLTAVHERSLREAMAARAYIKSLMKSKEEDGRPSVVTSWATAKEVAGEDDEGNPLDPAYLVQPNMKRGDEYADFKTIDHSALRGWKWSGEVDGKPIFVQGNALVHPDIYQKLKNNLGTSWYRQSAIGRTVMDTLAEVKNFVLSFSGFHQTTLGIHALEHKVWPTHMPELDLNDKVQSGLVDHGLMVAHYDAMEAFGEGVSSSGLVTKVPGIGPLYKAYLDYLFRDYMPRLKMQMAKAALERNRKRFPDLNKDQLYFLTASQANAAFGGLNYRMLGRNKTLQDTLRLFLMAPDFSEARARFVAQAGTKYGREQLVALMLGAAVLYTIARIINQMSDKNPHWDKPFSVVHEGREYRLRTVQGDLLDAATDPKHFLQNRVSPPVSAIFKEEDPHYHKKHESLEDKLKSHAQGYVPIPVQPWVQHNHDTNAQKAMETLLKIVGVNEKKEQKRK